MISTDSRQLDISALVQSDRVHSRIYTDPAVFEIEMKRIFEKLWLFVGHESEIPQSGDYKLRRMGKTPVIFIRGRDNVIRVLVNRCRHRGAQVCESEAGNARRFTCWYHGWSYDNTGALTGITQPEGYDASLKASEMGLSAVPRIDSYRGFVFASLSSTGESLRESLAHTTSRIDLLVDSSPTQEVFLDVGHNRTYYRGNWKLQGMDGYHPNYLHASVVAGWKRNADKGVGSTHRDDPYTDSALSRTRDLGNGHCMLDLVPHRIKSFDKQRAFLEKVTGGPAYIESMERVYGPERAKTIIAAGGDPHIGVFPNLQIANNHVRIVNPISPSYTEMVLLPVRVGGMSPEMNAERLRQHESFYGPCGAGAPDDAEMFERVQKGLSAELNPWLLISRGLHRQKADEEGNIVGLITDEVTQRAQIKRWKQLMEVAE